MASRLPDLAARPAPERTAAVRDGWVSTLVRWIGELLLTAGVVLLLFVAYLLWWTGVQTSADQAQLSDRLGRAVAAAPASPVAAKAGATPKGIDRAPPTPALAAPYLDITIPRLGSDWKWVVVEGVGLPQLALGPGHYVETVGPGEVGNFAVAGHRSGHGEPFAYLDRIRKGDVVKFSFGARSWTYRVERTFLTTPSDIGVVAAVPGKPGAAPTKRSFTLTTCNPRWGNSERLIITGSLQEGR